MAEPSKKRETLERPQASIGAQDLLVVGVVSKQGFLRKQGQLERTFKFLKWRQRFVVLSRGCIYIFSDELSSSPMKSLSMRVFRKCQRQAGENTRMRWAFDIIPEHSTNQRALSFSCSDDTVRREWMRACVEEMKKAKNVNTRDSESTIAPGNRDEYEYLEREVRSPLPAVPGSGSDSSETESDPEQEYTTIDETRISQTNIAQGKKSTPAPKGNTKPAALKQPKAKGKPNLRPPPPTPSNNPSTSGAGDIKRESFQYDGGDRDRVKDILTVRPEGTYLVRKSRKIDCEVLSVHIAGNLKEFKIFNKDNSLTINNNDYFPNVESLLKHYTQSLLPNNKARLYRAYSQTDPGYVN